MIITVNTAFTNILTFATVVFLSAIADVGIPYNSQHNSFTGADMQLRPCDKRICAIDNCLLRKAVIDFNFKSIIWHRYATLIYYAAYLRQ